MKSSSTTDTASEILESYDSSQNMERSVVIKPLKRRRQLAVKKHVGEITCDDLNSPKKARMSFNIAINKVMEQKKKIKSLQQANRRLRANVTNLKTLLKFLREKNYITENTENAIEASLPSPAAEIMKRLLKGSSKHKYSPALRSFALTLNFYSPLAYRYVRSKFNKSLPHPSTLSKWYQTVNGSPGFTKEALQALKIQVCMAMAIRKKIEWTGKKFTGYVDVGTNLNDDTLPEAKEVLVFLVTAINGHFKIPVGYFCIDGLTGLERANLVRQCLEFIHETGVKITSLTFDGAASNLSMANELGANLRDITVLKIYFLHPVTKDKVFIFLDVAHMIKLVRNCLGSKKTISTASKRIIDWKYFQELVDLQNFEGLTAGNKLKRRHLLWAREKMKVKIAAQTFSKSVSNALDFLRDDLKLEAFIGSEETSYFCMLINDIFDILNSRTNFCSYKFKKPLSLNTENEFFCKFSFAQKYFENLYLEGIPILNSNRKTGFIGFIIAIAYEYVKSENNLLKYLLGYKFSQDHIETFFGAIRRHHGFNNNPTAKQFESSYKRLLISSEVKAADTGNAVPLDNTSILYCSSRKITITDDNEDLESSESYINICKEIEDHDYTAAPIWHLTCFIENIVIYIAGFVVKCLKACVTCAKCLTLLEIDESSSLLQNRKKFGKLNNASYFVSDLCLLAERNFRVVHATHSIFNPKFKNINNFLISNTLQNLPYNIFNYFGEHIFDEKPEALNDQLYL